MIHGGLTLEQYAGVTAAVAEKIPLADVLAQEQIDATEWPAAERAWREAIVSAPDLQMQLIRKRRIAEDCLFRKAEPLDSDPGAWTGLLSAISLADDPDAVVTGLGITMADVGRLGRRWKQKAAADPEVAKKLQEVAPTAKAPTKLDVGPMKLSPFPWTPAPKAPEAPVAPSSAAASASAFPDGPIGEPQRHLASFQLKPVAATPAPQAVQPPSASETPLLGIQAISQQTAWAPSSATKGPSTPFEAPDPEARGVSLTQYATLVTKLQARGADRSAILSAAKLDEAAYTAVCAHYDKLFSKKAMLSIEFSRLLTAAQKALAEEKTSPSSAGRTEDMPAVSRATAAAMSAGKSTPPPTSQPTSQPPSGGAASADPPSAMRSAPTLSVAQYAWVFVTLKKATPADMPNVLERLRLTPESRRELDADWAAKIKKDSGVRYDFKQALARSMSTEDVEREVREIIDPMSVKGSGTAQLPDSLADLARPRAAALPFGGPAGAEPRAGAPDGLMPLAKYAQIAAMVAREGNPVGTLQRVGVDPSQWQANVNGYARQFAERPALRAEFDQLVQRWGLPR